MFKYARLGPSSLGTGRYHFERQVEQSHGADPWPVTQPQNRLD